MNYQTDEMTFDTEEQALEAATRALVLARQDLTMDYESLVALADCEPEADYDEGHWWAQIYDTEYGGIGNVARNLSIEWVG